MPRSRKLIPLVVGLALVALGLVALLFLVQRKVLFPRHLIVAVPDVPAGVEGREILRLGLDGTLLQAGGVPAGKGGVEAWFLPGKGVSAASPGPLLVFAHGNGEVIDLWPEALSPYRAAGVSLLLPEYRGYGRSEGTPSERAIRDDFVALLDLVTARPEVDAERVAYHGRSLGGGAVCALARLRPPRALILESTFTSIRDRAAALFIPGFLVRDPFDNEEVVTALDVPVLVMHGTRDGIVPLSDGEALAAAAPRGRFVAFDCGHNDFPGPDRAGYWAEIHALLRESGVVGR